MIYCYILLLGNEVGERTKAVHALDGSRSRVLLHSRGRHLSAERPPSPDRVWQKLKGTNRNFSKHTRVNKTYRFNPYYKPYRQANGLPQ